MTAKWIRKNLENKIYKYMAPVSKKVYTEKFDNTASNDNNSWNSAIKCKILLNSDTNKKRVKFGVSDQKVPGYSCKGQCSILH